MTPMATLVEQKAREAPRLHLSEHTLPMPGPPTAPHLSLPRPPENCENIVSTLHPPPPHTHFLLAYINVIILPAHCYLTIPTLITHLWPSSPNASPLHQPSRLPTLSMTSLQPPFPCLTGNPTRDNPHQPCELPNATQLPALPPNHRPPPIIPIPLQPCMHICGSI